MSCYPNTPVSILPPVSQGFGPLMWINGNQAARLNIPIEPSFFVYDGIKAWWANGSASQPLTLTNLQQEQNLPFLLGMNSSSQIVKTNFAVQVTNSLYGGTAGQIPVQTAPSTTGFIPVGEPNYLLTSTGASTPSWTDQGSITAGTATQAYTLTFSPFDSFDGGKVIYQNSDNETALTAVGETTQVLQGGGAGNAPTWVNKSSLSVGSAVTATTATTATNVANGAAGSLPYQTASSTTTTLPIGTANQLLTVNSGATAPVWQTGIIGVSGTVTGAASGVVGETLSWSSSATSITTGQTKDILTISSSSTPSLTTGDWQFGATFVFACTSTTMTASQVFTGGIGTTSVTTVAGQRFQFPTMSTVTANTFTFEAATPRVSILVSTGGTVYATATAPTFTGGGSSMTVTCYLTARRMR